MNKMTIFCGVLLISNVLTPMFTREIMNKFPAQLQQIRKLKCEKECSAAKDFWGTLQSYGPLTKEKYINQHAYESRQVEACGLHEMQLINDSARILKIIEESEGIVFFNRKRFLHALKEFQKKCPCSKTE